MLFHFIAIAIATLFSLLVGTGILHLVPRLGASGKRFSAALCSAPLLDAVVAWFTVLPLIYGPIAGGWLGLAAAVTGQVATVLIWSLLHELAHRDAVKGPRIVKVLNRIIGPWRNHAALWVTATVTPLFAAVRFAEIFLWPLLRWLVGFPRYRQGEWVNVSRHKFKNLVGHDLIWCLYCDWMTGVWSLGTEMLRNVESFWCPIRFDNTKKCANCTLDFPDVDGGWVSADSDMAAVAKVVEDQHGGDSHAWFGHPVRVTVKGNAVADGEQE